MIFMDMIIAKYKEDISWINNIKKIFNIVVYDKFDNSSNKLENVGREGHTYLNHIINNYNNLADITVFCQANPFVHKNDFIQWCNNIEFYLQDMNFLPLCNKAKEGPYGNIHSTHPLGLPIYYFFDLLFGIKLSIDTQLDVYYGAQFAARKEIILNRPIEFYMFLIKFLSFEQDPIEGYIIERLWPYILNTNYKLSNKYLQFL
jgi:hypothetical protein